MVVVGVKYNNSIFWFLGEEDIWFLNYNKIDTSLISEKALSSRKDFINLNKSNILTFLSQNATSLLPVEALKDGIKKGNENIFPALFIDFDNKVFYDNFPEPNNFSSAIDDDWVYSYEDLDNIVEKNEQYWINN